MSLRREHASAAAEPMRALVAGSAATVVVLLASLLGSVGQAGVAHVVFTAAAVGVLTALLASAAQHVVQPRPVRARPSGVSGAVPASTAYWCALEAPSCPQRPRAPGR